MCKVIRDIDVSWNIEGGGQALAWKLEDLLQMVVAQQAASAFTLAR